MADLLKNNFHLFHSSFKSNNYKEESLYNINHSLNIKHKKRKSKNKSSIKLPFINSYNLKNNLNINIKNKNKVNDILLFDDLFSKRNQTSLSNIKKGKIIFDIKLLNSPLKSIRPENEIIHHSTNNLKNLNNDFLWNNNNNSKTIINENLFNFSNRKSLKILDKIKKKKIILVDDKNIDKDKLKIKNNFSFNNNYIQKKISNDMPNNENEKNYESNEIIDEKKIILEEISNNNLKEYYKSNCVPIKEFAYKENQNKQYRSYMEDKSISILNFNGNKNNALFCIFDGHGGNVISSYLQNNFHYEFKEMLNSNKKLDFFELFETIDIKIKKLPYSYYQGSTACVVYITIENNKKILYCANVGDTRCLLTQPKFAKLLSSDHKVDNNKERERIIKSGGIINEGRIFGHINLSRAFGDWQFKDFGLISLPHVSKIEISNDDQYVIIASDGVWDVLEDLEIYRLSLWNDNAMELCSKIIEASLVNGSKDNLSCFVIKL